MDLFPGADLPSAPRLIRASCGIMRWITNALVRRTGASTSTIFHTRYGGRNRGMIQDLQEYMPYSVAREKEQIEIPRHPKAGLIINTTAKY